MSYLTLIHNGVTKGNQIRGVWSEHFQTHFLVRRSLYFYSHILHVMVKWRICVTRPRSVKDLKSKTLFTALSQFIFSKIYYKIMWCLAMNSADVFAMHSMLRRLFNWQQPPLLHCQIPENHNITSRGLCLPHFPNFIPSAWHNTMSQSKLISIKSMISTCISPPRITMQQVIKPIFNTIIWWGRQFW